MRRRYQLLVSYSILLAGIFLFSAPLPSEAASCVCAVVNSQSFICYKNTDKDSCTLIKQITDTQWINEDTKETSPGPRFQRCAYDTGNCLLANLGGSRVFDGPVYLTQLSDIGISCNGTVCSKVSQLTCQDDAPCQSYLGVCHNGFCYLPPAGKAKYDSLPQFLGVKADLQIRKPLFEIKIPGLNFSDVNNTIDAQGYIHIPYIGEFIAAAYKFGLTVASIVAVVLVIVSGLRIVASAGGEEKAASYKRIGQIVIGLVLAWGSYAILYNVNPDLVQFKTLKVKYIEPIPLSEPKNDDNTMGSASATPSCSDPAYKVTDLSKVNPSLSVEYANVRKLLTPDKVAQYKKAVAVTGGTVPWEALATVHFKEAEMRSAGSVLNGSAPCNTANDGDLLQWCNECNDKTFQNDLLCGAKKLYRKAGQQTIGQTDVETLKTVFCKYNGCFTCPDAHPYVTANFDAAHTGLTKQVHDCVPAKCNAGVTSDYASNPALRNNGCAITVFSSDDHPNLGLTNYCRLNQTASCKVSGSDHDGKVTYQYNNNQQSPSNPCGSWTTQSRAGALGIYAYILQLEKDGTIK